MTAQTAPKVTTLPRPDVTDLPDFDAVVPCQCNLRWSGEPEPAPCPNEARWQYRYSICGHVRTSCDAHHATWGPVVMATHLICRPLGQQIVTWRQL